MCKVCIIELMLMICFLSNTTGHMGTDLEVLKLFIGIYFGVFVVCENILIL